MQTQPMHPWDDGVPWLERLVPGSDTPERTPLQSLPFTIGRIDSADLQINSSRVSREHAVITRQGEQYHVRDLGSTNGTFVNGERIQQCELNDGDVLLVADSEFTFIARAEESPRRLATQLMSGALPAEPRGNQAHVLAVRRLQEVLLQRGFWPRLHPLVDLERNSTFALRAESFDAVRKGEPLSGLNVTTCRPLARAYDLYRLLAVEAFVNMQAEALLLVSVRPDEAQRGRALEAHLRRLAFLAGDKRLVVSVPANAVSDQPAVSGLCRRLKSAGLRLAYSDFLGGRIQVLAMADAPPDLLLLAPNLVSDLSASSRQHRQLQSLAEACNTIGCRPVVTGLRQRDEEESCLRLGLRWVATERWNRPLSTSSPKLLVPEDPRVASLVVT